MTKEKANRNEVVGMFLTYCRKTLVNARMASGITASTSR